jgi:hypothetical protein
LLQERNGTSNSNSNITRQSPLGLDIKQHSMALKSCGLSGIGIADCNHQPLLQLLVVGSGNGRTYSLDLVGEFTARVLDGESRLVPLES